MGDELYGRGEEIKQIWEILEGNSVLLVGPRRFGKTSITFEMANNPKHSWQVIYMDVEDLVSPEQLVSRMMDRSHALHGLDETARKLAESIVNSVEEVKLTEIGIKLRHRNTEWQNKANRVFTKIHEKHLNVVFVLDELPILLQKMQKWDDGVENVRLCLNWLRQIRHNYDIRLIICGSIGLQHIITACSCADTVNDLQVFAVKPISKEAATSLVKNLLTDAKIDFEDQHIDAILEQIGVYVPHFIKLFLRAIEMELNTKKMIDEEIIRSAYNERLLSLDFAFIFNTTTIDCQCTTIALKEWPLRVCLIIWQYTLLQLKMSCKIYISQQQKTMM